MQLCQKLPHNMVRHLCMGHSTCRDADTDLANGMSSAPTSLFPAYQAAGSKSRPRLQQTFGQCVSGLFLQGSSVQLLGNELLWPTLSNASVG